MMAPYLIKFAAFFLTPRKGFPIICFLFSVSAFAGADKMQEKSLVDPTVSTIESKKNDRGASSTTDKFQLQATKVGVSHRVAVINGRALREGETLEEWKVVKIETDMVTLRKQSAVQTVRLHPETNKRAPRHDRGDQHRRAP